VAMVAVRENPESIQRQSKVFKANQGFLEKNFTRGVRERLRQDQISGLNTITYYNLL